LSAHRIASGFLSHSHGFCTITLPKFTSRQDRAIRADWREWLDPPGLRGIGNPGSQRYPAKLADRPKNIAGT
jgi:hypothetical protein